MPVVPPASFGPAHAGDVVRQFERIDDDPGEAAADRNGVVVPGDRDDRQFFLQSLYRMFWFYPSRMRRVRYGWTAVSESGEATLFRHCEFSRTQRESFAFQLARRILIRAFPESFASRDTAKA